MDNTSVTDEDYNMDFNMMGSDLEKEIEDGLEEEVVFTSQEVEEVEEVEEVTVITYSSNSPLVVTRELLSNVSDALTEVSDRFESLSYTVNQPNRIQVILTGTEPASQLIIDKIQSLVSSFRAPKQVQDSADEDNREPNELSDDSIEYFQELGCSIDQWSTDEEIEIAVEDISADKEMAYR